MSASISICLTDCGWIVDLIMKELSNINEGKNYNLYQSSGGIDSCLFQGHCCKVNTNRNRSVGCSCKIRRLHLCRRIRQPPAPTIFLGMTLNCIWWWGSIPRLWGMWSSPSLPSFPSPLEPGLVVFVKVRSMGYIELFIFYQGIFLVIWNHTAVCKLFVLDKNTWYIELLLLNSNP